MSPAQSAAAVGILMSAAQAAQLALVLRAAFSGRLPRRDRTPWRWMTAAVGVELALSAGSATLPGHPALVKVLAVLRLLLALLVTAAVFAFPAARRPASERLTLTFDMTMIAGTGLLACWYFLVGPAVVRGVDTSNVLYTVAAPVMDLVAVSAAALVLLRGVPGRFRRPIIRLTCAAALLTVPSLYLAYLVAHGTPPLPAGTPPPPIGAALTAAFVLIALAAHDCLTPGHTPDRARDVLHDPLPYLPYLPYAAVGLGYVLLLSVAAGSGLYPWGGLVIGTLVMTGGLVARQLLPLLESRRLAVTDPLTGLSNRRGFLVALQRALDHSTRTDESVALLLLDLNGFKQINDVLGHAAGDAVLAAFARILRQDVLGRETVARLGGDEFAVLLNGIRTPGQAVVVAERVIADLAAPLELAGTPVQVRTSIGIALSSLPDQTPQDLLNRADLAMYDAKRNDARRGTTSTWRVYTDDLARRDGDRPDAPSGAATRP